MLLGMMSDASCSNRGRQRVDNSKHTVQTEVLLIMSTCHSGVYLRQRAVCMQIGLMLRAATWTRLGCSAKGLLYIRLNSLVSFGNATGMLHMRKW